ncbi:hypothetical protein LIER_38804 [Lithospermum erythrorhizon]|uniref:Uncharacterized protein n=1 Tax=Lithospermum erythrorhizon TaxID=34254 RepID=A0AAV3Q7K7_LITER
MFERFLKRNLPNVFEEESPIQALEHIKYLDSIFATIGIEDVHTSEKSKIERFRDEMILDIQSRLSLMTLSSVHELENTALRVVMEYAKFRARRDNKRRKKYISRSSRQINCGFQGHLIRQRRFTRSQFRSHVANTQFSSVGSV